MRTALLTIATLLVLTAAAAARPRRVVVLEFDGPSELATSAHGAVTTVLAERYDVVASRRWQKARHAASSRAHGPAAWARAAKEAGVDAVVEGWIEDDGRRYVLTVAVREAKTGQEIDAITVALDDRGVTAKAQKDLGADLESLLEWIDGGEPAARAEPEIEDADTVAPLDDADVDDEPAAADAEPDDDLVSLFGEGSEEAETVADQGPAAAGEHAAHRSIAIDAGGWMGSRSLTFTLPADIEGPMDFPSSPARGVAVRAAFFPTPHLGATVSFARSLGAYLTVDEDGDLVDYDVTAQAFDATLRYRRPFDRMTIELAGGYGGSSVAIEGVEEEFEIPDVSYRHVDAGAALEVPFGTRGTVSVGARYLYILEVGQIADPIFYGSGTAWGALVEARLEVPLRGDLYAAAGATYRRVRLDFDGDGEMSADYEVTSADDVFLGASASLGTRF